MIMPSKSTSSVKRDGAPPLLLYIRHGDDHHDARREARYPKHDHPLNRDGKARAARMARTLVERYGAPTAVYCSPFKRARQTADIMMDALDAGDRVRITIDPGLSRYFSRREQRRPSVGSDTHAAGPPPIRERNGEFGRRCRRQHERMVARHFFRRDDGSPREGTPVVWCITHALVMRRVAKRVGVVVPDDHVPFLGWFVTRPRTSRPSMRGLSDHGLGHACPERALAEARGVGPGRRRHRRASSKEGAAKEKQQEARASDKRSAKQTGGDRTKKAGKDRDKHHKKGRALRLRLVEPKRGRAGGS